MKPGLTLDVCPGHDVEVVCAEAQSIADILGRPVGFTFNSVRCVAMEGGSAERLAEMYGEAQQSEFVVYSNSAKVEQELKWDGR